MDNSIETTALKIAHFDFISKKDGKTIQTSKLLVSLGDFGVYECCTPLANNLKIFEKCKVVVGVDDYNKLVVKEFYSLNK